jgi:adenylosuccinate synthase
MNHIVVYGGQYGSEGKASAAEYWAKRLKAENPRKVLFVMGENGPNSGHTSSKGVTKNIPASSFWADYVLMGPDTVVDPEALNKDWKAVNRPIFIHEHAALLSLAMKAEEADLVKRISSTGSGTGAARAWKFFQRQRSAVVQDGHLYTLNDISVVDDKEYFDIVRLAASEMAIFECSQGLLLDTNFGLFPFVTSRSTLPRVAVERNGLGGLPWSYVGVYRTYPIRTGGPSGPTAGGEVTWQSLGQPPEITTVTKRVRRVFNFSTAEFAKSMTLARPDGLMFTFLDYIGLDPNNVRDLYEFIEWTRYQNIAILVLSALLVTST